MVKAVIAQVRQPWVKRATSFGPMAPDVEDAKERTAVLTKWIDIAQSTGAHSQVGRQVCEAKSVVNKFEVMADVMFEKSSNTLRKRANSFILFMSWAASRGIVLFPCLRIMLMGISVT